MADGTSIRPTEGWLRVEDRELAFLMLDMSEKPIDAHRISIEYDGVDGLDIELDDEVTWLQSLDEPSVHKVIPFVGDVDFDAWSPIPAPVIVKNEEEANKILN